MTELRASRYFFDASAALTMARAACDQWRADPASGLEIIYCHTTIAEACPINLVQLPLGMLSAYFIDTSLPIPDNLDFTGTVLPEDSRQDLNEAFQAAIHSVVAIRDGVRISANQLSEDAYFLDRPTALLTAMQANRVRLKHPTLTGLQICYFDGEPQHGDPENLVAVKPENFISFFTQCRLRFPTKIIFPPHVAQEQRQALRGDFKLLFEDIHRQKVAIAQKLYAEAQQLPPEPRHEDRPLRIMLPSNRQTTVMQFVSNNLAKALNAAGHDAKVSIEQNEMENMDTQALLQDYLAFRPDVMFNINHENSGHLHPAVTNIVWWQDPMPALQEGQPLAQRETDIHLSYSGQIDTLLQNCGATHIQRQHFCIDPAVFNCDHDIARQNKIVFIGSSYRSLLRDQPGEHEVLDELSRRLHAGEPITRADSDQLARHYGLDPHHVFWHLLHFTVRDLSVRWLCANSPIPAEIYGRDWDADPEVASHHRGTLPHGAAVAEVYHSARYALVVHPFEVNSQRLAEAAACGCIPVLFDCRHSAEAPHWESHALYYRTMQGMRDALSCRPSSEPVEIAEEFTYQRLAERVWALIDSGNSAARTCGTLASVQ